MCSSCSLCRQRKVRCDREKPCNHCSKSKNAVCDYGSNDNPTRTVFRTRSETSPKALENAEARTTANLPSQTSSDSPRLGINTPLSSNAGDSPAASSATLTAVLTKATFTDLCDAFYVHYEEESEKGSTHGVTQHIPRCVSHKTRLFGQSHWMSPGIALFRDLVDLLEKGNVSKALADVQRCKMLARHIKARRSPPWPTIPTRDLPSREIADALVDCYLSTTETVYRVLHVPSFQTAYANLWLPGTQTDLAFIIQAKLVFAIGAAVYDDTFSLRTSAIHWIHEAITWNASPNDFKSRLTYR